MLVEQWGTLEAHVLPKQRAIATGRKRFTAFFNIPY